MPHDKKVLYFYIGYSQAHDNCPRIKANDKPIKNSNQKAGVFVYMDGGEYIFNGNDTERLAKYKNDVIAFYKYYFEILDYSFRHSNELTSTEVVDIISSDMAIRGSSCIFEDEPLIYIPEYKILVSSEELKEIEKVKRNKYWENKNKEWSRLP